MKLVHNKLLHLSKHIFQNSNRVKYNYDFEAVVILPEDIRNFTNKSNHVLPYLLA